MKILSIDIGIKNLAYCLLEVTCIDDKKKYEIIKWDVINLCGEPPICQYVMENKKSKKKCVKKASIFRDSIFYCKTHANKMNCLFDTKENNIKKTTSLKDLQHLSSKYKIHCDPNSKKNDIYDKLKQYLDSNIFHNIKKVSASDVSLIEIGCSIYKNVSLHIDTNDIDTVIIENQISPLANRMKTIQGMVAQFFIMHNIQDIHFISATNKLKPFTKKKMNYKERKEYGIYITKNLIKENNIWFPLFSNHKKKDDLADSLLQGLWFLLDKKLITNENISYNNIYAS